VGRGGTRGRVTSKRSLDLVPRVAPLCGDEPTAMTYSPVGAYFQSLGVGGIELAGHPK
jgi:hypothetical protein